jgi:HlyD family secretion protein
MAAATLALAGMLLSACGSTVAATVPTPLPPTSIDSGVIAEGKVVPSAFVEVSFSSPGTVAELLVAEGDQVQAGAALARLDTRELELHLRQAEAAYAQADASYNDLRAGATPEQVALAKARVAQAEAGATQTTGNVTASDIAAARAQLAQARARLSQLQAGPKDTEVTQSQAQVDQAQANLAAQRDALSLAKTSAQRALDQAANQLRDVQDAYSRIYWDNREKEKYPGKLPQALIDAEESALRAVNDAKTGLAQAQAAYEQAVQAERDGLSAAESRLSAARAGVKQLTAGADADVIEAAKSQVAQAQANLNKLLGPSRQGSLDAAQAAVAMADAELAALTAGATDSALAVAQAHAQAAAADCDLARLMLEKATMVAPIAGVVAELNLKEGEAPPNDSPALVLADMQSWQIETEDLTELSVVRVREGDAAQISFDALSDLKIPGVVKQIKPMGKNRQGDIVYTVVVKPSSWDDRLRWNMTASVRIGS